MPPLGAHMSIAGGIHLAVERAAKSGCDCVQVFTKNNNQWRAKQLSDEDCDLFQGELDKRQIVHPIAHSSYLINLASPDNALWKKSLDAFVVEMRRIEQLGIPYLVIHPGSYTTSTEKRGLGRIVKALNEMDRQTKGSGAGCLLETMAGQGSNLGWRFEHLAELLQRVKSPERLGVCFDTCHVFAAGYDIRDERCYRSTMSQFNKLVGVKQIKAFHLNDSLKELGSRKDRHAHIGKGEIGSEGFRCLMNDRRFSKIPMYLETPKGEKGGRDLDRMNLRKLRGMIEA